MSCYRCDWVMVKAVIKCLHTSLSLRVDTFLVDPVEFPARRNISINSSNNNSNDNDDDNRMASFTDFTRNHHT